MFVLGLDPGLSRCGYAVVERLGSATKARAIGVIRTDRNLELPERLSLLNVELKQLMVDFRPDVVSIEQVFFQNNVRSAMSVGQASGLAMVAAQDSGALVVQYTPTQVKQAVAGVGNADKAQIAQMVQTLLGLRRPPEPADAADAAALALCHLAYAPLLRARAAGKI